MTEVINGLKLSLAANDQINFIIIDTLVKGEALFEFTDTLEADSVQNICTKNNASMLYKSRGALAGIAIFDPSIYKAEKDIKPHLIFLSHMKRQEI